jgi:hypothetical protein
MFWIFSYVTVSIDLGDGFLERFCGEVGAHHPEDLSNHLRRDVRLPARKTLKRLLQN